MSEIPETWRAYARLQQELAQSHQPEDRTWRVNDRSWGLEAALNRFLGEPSPLPEDVDRAVRSAERRERHQQQLLRHHLAAEEAGANADGALDARHRLRLIKGQVTPEEWALLRAVAVGYACSEIAAAAAIAAGTLRVRVSRLRRTLASQSHRRG